MRLEHQQFTFDEWSGAASFSQHAGKIKFKPQAHARPRRICPRVRAGDRRLQQEADLHLKLCLSRRPRQRPSQNEVNIMNEIIVGGTTRMRSRHRGYDRNEEQAPHTHTPTRRCCPVVQRHLAESLHARSKEFLLKWPRPSILGKFPCAAQSLQHAPGTLFSFPRRRTTPPASPVPHGSFNNQHVSRHVEEARFRAMRCVRSAARAS